MRLTVDFAECLPAVVDTRHKRQIYASLAAASGMIVVGSTIGWTSAALPSLKHTTFPFLRSDQESWIGSIVPLAALIAGPLFGTAVDRIGRKPTMVITAFLSVLGWCTLGFATSVEHLYAGRFISGLCVGASLTSIPTYVSDVTEKEIRGTLSTAIHLFSALGTLLSFLIGSFVDWNWSAFISATFPLVFLLLILQIPESPRFYIDAGRNAEAAAALAWLRAADREPEDESSPLQVEIKEELHTMAKTIAEVRAQTLTLRQTLLSRRIRLPLAICLVMMILQQLTGYNAVLFYMVEIFEALGSTHAYFSSIVMGIVGPLFMVVSTVFMDTAGRKPLLITSAVFVAAAHFINGTYLLARNAGYSMALFAWLPTTSFILFFGAYALGLGPVPFVIMSEILPNHVIGVASGLTTMTHFTFAFLVTRYFNGLSELIGMDWTFYFGALWALLAAIFVVNFVPETKLKTLEEIQEFWKERLPVLGGLLEGGEEEEEGDEGAGADKAYNTFGSEGGGPGGAVEKSETEF